MDLDNFNFRLYWAVWLAVVFITFILPELLAIRVGGGNTLSHQVWRWLEMYIWLRGLLAFFLLWLIIHFLIDYT